jgi:diguanylate cyclase (GGDEF)-like protein
MNPLPGLDLYLNRLTRAGIWSVAACGVGIVGYVDYVTGFEVSVSVFYLGPVALAAWYAGRWTGATVGLMSTVSWYVADYAAGEPYLHPAITAWNGLVRFWFFLTVSMLVTALRASYLRVAYLARMDGLTDLYGRRTFEDRLEHDLALARRHKTAVTLVYIDLDDFKSVNDNEGHAAGDRVLQEAGRVFRGAVRQADTLARLGGDEFAVILPDTDSAGARDVVGNITRGFQMEFEKMTCSIGVVTFLDPILSVPAAIDAADEAMYEAKRKGKGKVVFSVHGQAVQQFAVMGSVIRR